jgi:hypothetical protein
LVALKVPVVAMANTDTLPSVDSIVKLARGLSAAELGTLIDALRSHQEAIADPLAPGDLDEVRKSIAEYEANPKSAASEEQFFERLDELVKTWRADRT